MSQADCVVLEEYFSKWVSTIMKQQIIIVYSLKNIFTSQTNKNNQKREATNYRQRNGSLIKGFFWNVY